MPKRLFIAADISDEARILCADLIKHLRDRSPRLETGHPPKVLKETGVSWTKPENLHVTLKFLGDTDAPTEASLVQTLQRIAAETPPFTLRFAGPELLGKRVVSIKIASDTPTVFSLEQRIDTECERLGFKREGRRFHPHLTLARIRDPRAAAPLSGRFLQTELLPVAFDVTHITLYESTLTPSGSIYKTVVRIESHG